MDIKTKPDGSVTFELSIPWKKAKQYYDKVLAQSAKTVEIKGFRKGKAPLSLVEKNIDKSKLYNEVIRLIIPDEYIKVIKKNKLAPIIDPRIVPLKLDEGKPWEFKIETSQRPEIKLGAYKTYVKKALKNLKPPKKDDKNTTQPQENPQYKTVFDALLKNAQVKVSDFLIEEEVQQALTKLLSQLKQLNLEFKNYLKSIKKSQEEFIAEYKKSAEDNLKLEFILSELVKQENPPVKDSEVAKLKPTKGQESYVRYRLQKKKIVDNLLKL